MVEIVNDRPAYKVSFSLLKLITFFDFSETTRLIHVIYVMIYVMAMKCISGITEPNFGIYHTLQIFRTEIDTNAKCALIRQVRLQQWTLILVRSLKLTKLKCLTSRILMKPGLNGWMVNSKRLRKSQSVQTMQQGHCLRMTEMMFIKNCNVLIEWLHVIKSQFKKWFSTAGRIITIRIVHIIRTISYGPYVQCNYLLDLKYFNGSYVYEFVKLTIGVTNNNLQYWRCCRRFIVREYKNSTIEYHMECSDESLNSKKLSRPSDSELLNHFWILCYRTCRHSILNLIQDSTILFLYYVA